MSVSPIAENALQQLRQQLLETFDRNRDGSLDGQEFVSVLRELVNGDGVVNTERAQSGTTPGPSSVLAHAHASPSVARSAGAPLEGFNQDKLSTSDSPKYRFARVAMQYGLSDVHGKSAAEARLQQMLPDFEREGLDVLDVEGDRIKIRHEGREIWIDVIRAASVGAQAFQWLPEED